MTRKIDGRMIDGLSSYPPQAIIKAPLGLRPSGLSPQDCDAPVVSMIAGDNLVHSSHWGPMGIIRASTEYTTSYPAWKICSAANAAETDAWLSSANTFSGGVVVDSVNGQWVEIEFHTPRSFDRIFMSTVYYSASWANVTPKDFQVIGNGVVLLDKVGYVPDALGSTGEFLLTTPAVNIKKLRVKVTRIQNSVAGYVAIGKLEFGFTDAVAGHLTIPAGLQVAYAENGQVHPSDELNAPIDVDLTAESDGIKHVYVDPDTGGTIVSAGFTDLVPLVGPAVYTPQQDQTDVTSITSSNTPSAGALLSLVNGSTASYVQWTVPMPWVEFNALSGKLMSASLYAPRSQNQVPKSWVIEGYNGSAWVTVASQTTATVNDWVEGVYKDMVVSDSTNYYEKFRLRVTESYGSGVIFTDIKLATELERGDFYNHATVNMLDSADAPIRRVYLGSVVKNGGTIVAVHCNALGRRVRVPANGGANLVGNTIYSIVNPFGYDGVRVDAKYKKDSEWRPHPTIYYYGTTGYGRRYGKLDSSKYEWGYKDYVDSDAAGNVTAAPVTIIFERGY